MFALPRRTGAASIATLTAFSTAFILAHAIAPQWAHAVGLDVWSVGADAERYRDIAARGKELDALQESVSRQAAASDVVADRLVAGEVALAEATDELDAINRSRSGFEISLEHGYAEAPTHRLRVARYTIAKATARVAGDPTRLAEVSTRLEAEYRAMTCDE